MTRYFLDSYVLIEMFRGNPAFGRFRRIEAATTFFQIAETYYKLLELGFPKEAKRMHATCNPAVVPVRREVLHHAMEFRLRERTPRGERYSYADAVGYTVARWLGVPFATGDDGFRGRVGVEWAK